MTKNILIIGASSDIGLEIYKLANTDVIIFMQPLEMM